MLDMQRKISIDTADLIVNYEKTPNSITSIAFGG